MAVAVGDETFHTIQIPAAVGFAVCGFEHDGLQVRTGIGLGQVHGHGLTGAYAGQVFLFLLFAGKFVDGLGAVLQTPDVYETGIGAAHHIGSHDVGYEREVEAVVAAGHRDTHQPGFYQGVEVLLRALGIYHVAVDYVGTLVVYVFGVGGNDFATDFTGDFEHLFVTVHGVLEVEGRIVIFFGIGVVPFP